jgi:hypothetical protein
MVQLSSHFPQDQFVPPELMGDLDLSSSTIAQYLLMTGDFDGFNNALGDVLATGIVSHSLTPMTSRC